MLMPKTRALRGGDVLFEVVEGRSLFHARRAPAGPEVEDHDFAAEVGEAGGFAGDIEREVFGGLAGDGGFALAIAGQRKDQDDRRSDGQTRPVGYFSADCHR